MATLSTKRRNALSTKQFAGPDRSYPAPDADHAANAKARATQAVNSGRITQARLHEALVRIIALKVKLGLLQLPPASN